MSDLRQIFYGVPKGLDVSTDLLVKGVVLSDLRQGFFSVPKGLNKKTD